MTNPNQPLKVISLRLSSDEHTSLALIAKLEDVSITTYIRDAIAAAIARSTANPDLVARAAVRAEELRDEVERSTRALEALFPIRNGDTS